VAMNIDKNRTDVFLLGAQLDSNVVDPLNVWHEQPLSGRRSRRDCLRDLFSRGLLPLINGSS